MGNVLVFFPSRRHISFFFANSSSRSLRIPWARHVQKRERAKREQEAKRLLVQQQREKRKLEEEGHRVQKQREREERKREQEHKRERRLREAEEREQERLRRLRWHEEIKYERERRLARKQERMTSCASAALATSSAVSRILPPSQALVPLPKPP